MKNYLDESTEPKITRVAEHELITMQVGTPLPHQLQHNAGCASQVQCAVFAHAGCVGLLV